MNCWIEVNLGAIRHNYREIKALVGESVKVIAVIKANAYGHGAVEVARVLSEEGAPYLAVTRLDEALPIRAAGILTPILLLAPPLPDEMDEVVAQNLTACVASIHDAKRLAEAAARRNMTARAHLKVNTGMGRLGVEPDDAGETAGHISTLSNIELEGCFTHFAFAAERDPSDTHAQFSKFQPLIHWLNRGANIPRTNFHCANSAAILRFPSMRLSTVRPGTLLYGQFPSVMAAEAAQTQRVQLRDGFQAKARVLTVREVKRGQTVGYGGEWRASRASRIATIAVGYADGLSQEPNTRELDPGKEFRNSLRQTVKRAAQMARLADGDPTRTVRIRGEKARIIGRIAMQQCSVDVTDIDHVEVGDEVQIWMRRISAGAHLPRVYKDTAD